MATTWGSYSNRLRFGINMVLVGSVTQASPEIIVDVDGYTETDYSYYNNDINWNRSTSSGGTDSGSARLTNDQQLHLEAFTSEQLAIYSGTKTYSVTFSGSGSGAGPASYTRSITIPRRPTGQPTAPGTPTCSDVRSTSMDVTWGAPSDLKGGEIDYYRVEVSTTSSFSNIVKNPTSTDRSVTITGLDPGETYYVRIRAAVDGWDQDWTTPNSATRTVTMDYVAPSSIGGRANSGITSSSFTQTWSEPNNGGKAITKYGYEVRLGNNPDSRTGTIVKSGETTTRTLTATGLSPYTDYTIHQRAYNGLWGPWQVDAAGGVGSIATTLANAPTLTAANAYNITRSSATFGQVIINNNGGQPPTNLRVEYNTTASSTGSTVVTKGSFAAIVVNGLAPMTHYYYRLAAANSAGWGPYTGWGSFDTLDAVPSEPAAPTVTPITDTTATVNWVTPALNGAMLSGFEVVLAQTDDPDAPFKSATKLALETSHQFTGLTPGTVYYAYVKALGVPSDSGWSTEKQFSTTGTVATLFLYLNVAGTYRTAELWENVGGTWKKVKLGLKVGTIWKETV